MKAAEAVSFMWDEMTGAHKVITVPLHSRAQGVCCMPAETLFRAVHELDEKNEPSLHVKISGIVNVVNIVFKFFQSILELCQAWFGTVQCFHVFNNYLNVFFHKYLGAFQLFLDLFQCPEVLGWNGIPKYSMRLKMSETQYCKMPKPANLPVERPKYMLLWPLIYWHVAQYHTVNHTQMSGATQGLYDSR